MTLKRQRTERRRLLAKLTLQALKGFREKTAIAGRRLFVLRDYAKVVLPVDPWVGDVMVARRDHNRSRHLWRKDYRDALCFVCRTQKATQAHHIIQIQHGGSDIHENKVPICRDCHADIHPWMPVDETPAVDRPLWSR